MHILRTHGLLFALFISLLVTDTSVQIAPQSGDAPTQSSAAPTAVTSGQVLFTVSDDSGNAVPAPAKDSLRLRIDKQPVEIEEIRPLKNSPLFFSVLLDISGSSKQFADQQIAAATKLFADLSTGENHGYLILFKSEIATSDRFIGTSSVEEILRRFPPPSRSGGTALYDAIIHATTEQLSSMKVADSGAWSAMVGGHTSARGVSATMTMTIINWTKLFPESRN